MNMSILICPQCGAENPSGVEICRVCQGLLTDGTLNIKPEHTHGFENIDEGLIQSPEEDLTGLLRSLKEDDSFMVDDNLKDESLPLLPVDDGEGANNMKGELEPDLPEWLMRIRDRITTEEDSVGETTQRIKAAQESLEGDPKKTQKQEFKDVIRKIQEGGDGQAQDKVNAQTQTPLDGHENEGHEDDWLTRLRKKHKPSLVDDEEDALSDRQGDSLLQWLIRLEENEVDPENDLDELLTPSEKNKEDTQKVDVVHSADGFYSRPSKGAVPTLRRREAELIITREEQARADQLTAIILDENAIRPKQKREKPFIIRGLRQVMGIFLILVLSLALFLKIPGNQRIGSQASDGFMIFDWVQSLGDEANLLLILNYRAGFSGELDLVLKPMLERLAKNKQSVSIMYSSPTSGLLFQRLASESEGEDSLVVQDLGFYPVNYFGAFGLAIQMQSNCQITSQPEFQKKLPSDAFDGILIISDNDQGAMTWVEQYSAMVPGGQIYLVTTDQAAPLLQPYLDSAQVKGMVSGIDSAMDINEESAGKRLRAYQIGIAVMMFTLLAGLAFPATGSPQRDGRGEK